MFIFEFFLQKNSLILLYCDGLGPNAQLFNQVVNANRNASAQSTRYISTQNAKFQQSSSDSVATAVNSGVLVANNFTGKFSENQSLQNIFEYLRERHPEYLTGLVTKSTPVNAIPSSFIGHYSGKPNNSLIYENIVKYAKADLIISAGYSQKQLKPYWERFDKQGYNTIDPNDYIKNNQIINKTKLPLFGSLSFNDNFQYYIDKNEDSYKIEPDFQQLIIDSVQKLSHDKHPYALMIDLSLISTSIVQNNKSRLAGELAELQSIIQSLIVFQKQSQNTQILLIAPRQLNINIGDISQIKNFPLINESNQLSLQNYQRTFRANAFELNFNSTQQNSHIGYIQGFGNYFTGKKHSYVKQVKDIRLLMQNIIENKNVTTFTSPQNYTPIQNGFENIFNDRYEEYSKPYPKYLLFGVLIALSVIIIIVFIVLICRQQKKRTTIKKKKYSKKMKKVQQEGLLV